MCFSRFLNCTDSTKSSKASHIIRNFFDFWFPFSYILLIWFSNVSFESIIIPRSSSISSRLNAVIDNITIAVLFQDINLLCANPNGQTQFAGKLPKNCLNVFDHFVGLALRGLRGGPYHYLLS